MLACKKKESNVAPAVSRRQSLLLMLLARPLWICGLAGLSLRASEPVIKQRWVLAGDD